MAAPGGLVYRALFLSLIVLVITGSLAVAQPQQPSLIDRDDAEDCNAFIPETYATPLEKTPILDLRVHVLLDGIGIERGQQIMAQVADTYEGIGIKLQATYQEVDIEPDTTETRPTYETTPAHSVKIMYASKDAVGGARPWGADVVYTMTSDFIAQAAGYADCIAGVRYPTQAFAVGEAAVNPGDEQGRAVTNESAKIAAHEIAHLLGAHHHYANCAESEKSPELIDEFSLCTVMINDVGLVSLDFSTLEASAVRGHVADFAMAASQGPERVHPRTVSLKISKKWMARGEVTSPVPECVSELEVTIERRSGSGWAQVAADNSWSTGNYDIEIPAVPGTYRAVIEGGYMVGDTHRESCAAAVSGSVRPK